MIFFDRKTLSILKHIKKSGDIGDTWGALQQKYGHDVANPVLLEQLSRELYTVTQDSCGNWQYFDESWDGIFAYDFRSFCTPKRNELLETRCFNFWKWMIPTSISIVALFISILGILL